jgi:hypothetical protein
MAIGFVRMVRLDSGNGEKWQVTCGLFAGIVAGAGLNYAEEVIHSGVSMDLPGMRRRVLRMRCLNGFLQLDSKRNKRMIQTTV